MSCEQRIFTGLYTVNVESANQTVHGKEENTHQPSEETIDDFVTFQIPLSEENRTCAKYYKFVCLCRKQSNWYSVAAHHNEVFLSNRNCLYKNKNKTINYILSHHLNKNHQR